MTPPGTVDPEAGSGAHAAGCALRALIAICMLGAASSSAASGEAADAEQPASYGEARLGARYDWSERTSRDALPQTQGSLFHAGLSGSHDRRVASFPWRTSAEAYADVHTSDSDEDYYSLAGWTGPGAALGGPWSLSSAFGGQISLYDYDLFGLVGDFYLTLESDSATWVRSVELRAAYEDYRGEFDGYDAPVGSLTLGLATDEPPLWGDGLWLVPSAAYYGATRAALRHTEVATSLAWGGPLRGPLRLDLEAYGSWRDYASAEADVGHDRRDWYALGTAVLALSPFFGNSHALEARYVYERNWSNDAVERYDGHSVGLFFVWTR